MKRKFHHPEVESSHRQWRSLGELEGSEEFSEWLEREFPQGASEYQGDENSRRDFVKLMGASTALAGFGVACSRPVRHLVPFNEHVEWAVPGKALYYSSFRPSLTGMGGDPLVVTTYDGRPTKVDGNKLHPVRSGGSDQYTQASVLDLYNPDRSRGYLKGGAPTTKVDFDKAFFEPFSKARSGEKVAFLVEKSTSPTRNRLIREIAEGYSGSKFYAYSALEGEGRKLAEEDLFGKGIVSTVDLSKARRVLSVDCDFLGADPVGEDSTWEFSKARKVDGDAVDEMNRLYVVEPAFTLTGGMADHRYRLSSSQVLAFLSLLAKEIGGAVGGMGESLGAVSSVFDSEWISQCAADLVELKGESVVLVGSRHSKECHMLAAAINGALGAYGAVISGVKHDLPELEGLVELVEAISAGDVETLFILGEGDVLFDAPSDLMIADALDKVATVVHVGSLVNLTAKSADWHVPGTHYLETWGDCFTVSGYYSVQQPMIDPMWGGISEISFYLNLLATGEESIGSLDAVKETAASVSDDWVGLLRNGFVAEASLPSAPLTVANGKVNSALSGVKLPDLPYPESLDVVLTVGRNFDGRFSNNPWLQEAPDPITKLTWDNAALISVKTAEALGLEDGDLVEIAKEGGSPVTVPILRSPGHAEYTLTVEVGYYGDTRLGRICDHVGFNVYPLKTTKEPLVVSGVTLKKLGDKHKLALTAEHYSMEGRAIVREGTVDMLEEDAEFAQHQGMDHHIPENVSLYKGPDYRGETHDAEKRNEANQAWALKGHAYEVDPNHQWAMTIDLNACTGCNSCVIACQAENNIPVVGKNQVLAGREMHWIRMDRYFTSPNDHEIVSERGFSFNYDEEPGRRHVDDDNIEMLPQPVACQQCESAPCETVCPVNATVHTGDGLNAMVYNRCIGTRYCANNCPYKARRFNYYDYNKRPIEDLKIGPITAPGVEFGPLAPASGHATTTMQLQNNPNVTVRMRGVIEKCTYCVQRITAAKVAAKAAARDSADIQVKPNSFTVACQDACQTEAIVFGNLKAKGDRVIDSKNNPRNYDLLKYIGTLPRTSYLARIKNPNMKMPGADKVGTVTSKMH
ncbi:MAG: TAT-variant-translocated molybdopterin oxidoreductase [Verrucomicrobiales bacterium]|nr:TAT-variant-translocated molybdopterin oxidoreductase [Verrucomicrobiales bacterium]